VRESVLTTMEYEDVRPPERLILMDSAGVRWTHPVRPEFRTAHLAEPRQGAAGTI